MSERVPKLTTDAEAEAFLARDLIDLDFSQFKPMRLELEKKELCESQRSPESAEQKEAIAEEYLADVGHTGSLEKVEAGITPAGSLPPLAHEG